MARDHARINLDIWGDDDWLDLSWRAQHLYFVLYTAPQLSFCGAGPWHPGRLANRAADWTANDIEQAAAELSEQLFLFVDTETEEFLLRSWIKHDGLWRTPNMAVTVAKARGDLASRTLRGVIVFEVAKLAAKHPESTSWARPAVANMLGQNAVDPTSIPPFNPGPKGGANPGSNPTAKGYGHPGSNPGSNGGPTLPPTPLTPTPEERAQDQLPDEPPIDDNVPIEIESAARPSRPSKPSSSELSFIRLHVGQKLPRDIETGLVTEVRKLRTFERPVIEAALQNWATRDCSPKLLSNLVSDELKRRRTPSKPRTLTKSERQFVELELMKDNPDPVALRQLGINPPTTNLRAINGGQP